jgi:hypothetical protein
MELKAPLERFRRIGIDGEATPTKRILSARLLRKVGDDPA